MKNFINVIAAMSLICGVAHAGSFPVSVVNKVGETNSVTYGGTVAGKLNTIVIDVTGVTTGALTITSARTGETILSETITADTVRRVRFPVHSTTGTEIGVATNDMVKFILSNDTLTYTLAETATAADSTYTILIITE
jgi:hypothetical protein